MTRPSRSSTSAARFCWIPPSRPSDSNVDRRIHSPMRGPWRMPIGSATTPSTSGIRHDRAMRPGLLYPDRDLDVEALPELDPTLVAAPGAGPDVRRDRRGDRSIDRIVRRVVADRLETVEAIRYRQATLTDALASPDVVRQLHAIAADAVEGERKVWAARCATPSWSSTARRRSSSVFLGSFRSDTPDPGGARERLHLARLPRVLRSHRIAARRRVARRGRRSRSTAANANPACQRSPRAR